MSNPAIARDALRKDLMDTHKQLKARADRTEAKVKRAVRAACVERTCKACGKLFSAQASHAARRAATTCSRACYFAARAFNAYTGPCVMCGAICVPTNAAGRWREFQKTCSKRCQYRFTLKLDAPPKAKTCKQCGTLYQPLPAGGRLSSFCSRKCYHEKLSAHGWIVKPCDQCGVTVRRRRQWVHARIFCGKECSRLFFTAEQSPMWRGGASLHRGKGWQRIAELIRQRDNLTCRRCGKTQAENKQKLSVDHVRPWRERESEEQANDPSNLVSLCRPCHSRKAKLERRWLNGDGLALLEYRRSVGIEVTS